jgi:starch phosphorylase
MEIAADPRFPTYSGGLGVLAGDTLRSAADLGIPMVGVTLMHLKGYFRQHLDEKGQQSEESQEWSPEKVLEPTKALFAVHQWRGDASRRAIVIHVSQLSDPLDYERCSRRHMDFPSLSRTL